MRSPSRQLRTTSVGAESRRIEHGEVGALGSGYAGLKVGAHLPAAEATDPRHRQRGLRGLAGRTRREAHVSLLDLCLDPSAELDHTALGLAHQAPDLRRPRAAERHLPAGGSLRQLPQSQPAQRRIQRAQRVAADRTREIGTRLGHHLGGGALKRVALLGELSLRLGDRRLGFWTDLAQHGQDLVPNPVARIERLDVRRIVAEWKTGFGCQQSRLVAPHGKDRSDQRAPSRPQPEERAAPRRGREPVEHRLGQIRASVTGGDPVESPRPAQPFGGLVARVPGGSLDVAATQFGPFHLELGAEFRAELADCLLVQVRIRTEAVVEVERRHGAWAQHLDEPRRGRG